MCLDLPRRRGLCGVLTCVVRCGVSNQGPYSDNLSALIWGEWYLCILIKINLIVSFISLVRFLDYGPW